MNGILYTLVLPRNEGFLLSIKRQTIIIRHPNTPSIISLHQRFFIFTNTILAIPGGDTICPPEWSSPIGLLTLVMSGRTHTRTAPIEAFASHTDKKRFSWHCCQISLCIIQFGRVAFTVLVVVILFLKPVSKIKIAFKFPLFFVKHLNFHVRSKQQRRLM